MAKLTKEEFDKKVRELIEPEAANKPKLANLMEMVGNAPRLPMQQKAGAPMIRETPTQNPAMNPSVNPLGTFTQNQGVTAMQKYPFLGTK